MNFFDRLGKRRIVAFAPILFLFVFSTTLAAQDRDRVVEETNKKPTASAPAPRKEGLTNKITIVRTPERSEPLVKKTAMSSMTMRSKKASASYYNATLKAMILKSINDKLGIRYVYGTQGPNAYDCSGFVWKVFEEAGLPFTRTSAAQYWRTFEPVSGDERYQFGTLVFFNRLGHVGIVVDKNGFYHASSSRGITYSKFNNYWNKRIVGFRRVPLSALVLEEPAN